MTKLDSEEWRNVKWVISPTSALVCWLCQPWSRSPKPSRRVQQACFSVTPLPPMANTGHTISKDGWWKPVKDISLHWQNEPAPPRAAAPAPAHTVAANLLSSTPCWPSRLMSPVFKSGKSSFLHHPVSSGLLHLHVTLLPPKCRQGDGLVAWEKCRFAIKGTRVTGCFFWFPSPSFQLGYF